MSRRPNIIFIQSDSMDGRAMGCAGHPAAHTPAMDAIAERGVLFQNAYCNSPQCVPSRASMWSGRHVHSCEGWSNYKGLSPDCPTFRDALDTGGYRTAILGRTDHLTGAHTLGCNLAIWTRAANINCTGKGSPRAILEETNSRRLREVDWQRVDEAKQWLRESALADGTPFFMYLGFIQPHPGSGFRTTPYYRDLIDPDRVTIPPRDESRHPAMVYMRTTKNCDMEFTGDEIREMRRHYFAMIAELDAMVGEVLGVADDLDLLDSTYVIYTSDHGEMNLEHGQYLKNALYEGPARVPLVIAGPGVRRKYTCHDLVSLVDIFPAFMDMADIEHPDGLEGHSLLPLLEGRQAKRPDWVLSQYHANMQNTGSFMFRRGDWKLIEYVGLEPQLFNLREDPDEIVNRAASDPDACAGLRSQLQDVVDCAAVDARAKAFDRECFRRWRAEVGEDAYHETMTSKFKGWGEMEFARIEKWLRA